MLERFRFDDRGTRYQISHVGWEDGEFWVPDRGCEEEIDELVLGECGEVCAFLLMSVSRGIV